MAFTLLRVLGAPSRALCKARGCLASWPGLIPFLSLSWLWSCRCRACSCRWSTSTGHCTKLLPGDCWTWYLCLTHSSQTWICSQLQIPSSSCSVSCMGVVGLDPAVDLTVGPHHALIPQAARLHFVCFFRQGLSLNLEQGWPSASYSDPPVSNCPKHQNYKPLQAHVAFCVILGIQMWVLILGQQVLSPTKPTP